MDRGGGGQTTLDKQRRRGEGRVKRRTNEKHPCGKALSHLPQLTVSSASLLSLALCPCKNFPTVEQKLRKALWFHLEQGEGGEWWGFFTEESMATTTTKKKYKRGGRFSLSIHNSLVPFLPLGLHNLCHITSTKNSPALPTAMRRDCRDAVSSGGTEASSLPGGAPGAAVDRCAG